MATWGVPNNDSLQSGLHGVVEIEGSNHYVFWVSRAAGMTAEGATWLIGKNYASFAALDGELRNEVDVDTLPVLPKKSSFGRSKDAVIMERQTELERYLSFALSNPGMEHTVSRTGVPTASSGFCMALTVCCMYTGLSTSSTLALFLSDQGWAEAARPPGANASAEQPGADGPPSPMQ